MPRSTTCLRDTRWRDSVSCADIPRDRWLRGSVGLPAELDTTHPCQAVEELRHEILCMTAVIFCGHPKRAMQPQSMACDTVSAVMIGMWKASGQRVLLSTDVRQY